MDGCGLTLAASGHSFMGHDKLKQVVRVVRLLGSFSFNHPGLIGRALQLGKLLLLVRWVKQPKIQSNVNLFQGHFKHRPQT